MDFLNGLDRKQRQRVEVIIEDNADIEWKLRMLKGIHIADDICEKIKNFLISNGRESSIASKSQKPKPADVERGNDSPHFLSLITGNNAKTAQLTFGKKSFTLLTKLIGGQSDECKKSYQKYMKEVQEVVVHFQGAKGVDHPQTQNPANEENTNVANSSDEDEHKESIKDTKQEWKPNITPKFFEKLPSCLNILVLGETGVGKSTFINGLGNYLRYSNMHEAKHQGVQVLIKTSFLCTDKDGNAMRINCDPTIENGEENENTVTGQSSTQTCKAYKFQWGPPGNAKTIQIIDTPGVGDNRGPAVDKTNFANILSYIANYPEIHAILILMKPNVSRLTLTYRYCIKELLTHLHISASRNIIFCFTNARSTFYRPGDTRRPLQALLDSLQKERKVKITLDGNTMFCFDNESFRFLSAWKEGTNFADDEIEDFNGSWKRTVEDTFRLFERISELETHKTETTLSVNNVRSIVLAMARPLAEIAKNQMLNARLIEMKLKEIEDLKEQGKDLSNIPLYVDQIFLSAKEIDHPITVCTNERCIEVLPLDNGTLETYYKKKCHPHCYLTGVKTGVWPNSQIKNCACFAGNPEECRTCFCDWRTHLHITFELAKTVRKVGDYSSQNDFNKCTNKIEEIQKFIENKKREKLSMEAESKTILNHCAEFAAFIKKNSFIPYNDAYKEYIEFLIDQESIKINHGEPNTLLIQLKNYHGEYEQQIKILESHGSLKTSTKTIGEIYTMFNELRQMKNCGPLLAQLEKIEMLSVRKQQANDIINVDISNGWLHKKYAQGTASPRPASCSQTTSNSSNKKPGNRPRF